MTDEAFLQLVDKGVTALGASVLKRFQNVAIVIKDSPSQEQRRSLGTEDDDVLFGLYEGVPQTERGIDAPFLPDVITIFKEPILAAYDDPLDIAACVENTLWHEVAHHFGGDEEWVAAEELRRGKAI